MKCNIMENSLQGQEKTMKTHNHLYEQSKQMCITDKRKNMQKMQRQKQMPKNLKEPSILPL